MNRLIFSIFILFGGLAFAQSPTNTSINSGGQTNNSLSFSVGQGVQGPFGSFNLSGFQYIASDYESPSLTLTSSSSNTFVSNTDVVTLTATFSESMAATPTLSLSGIFLNELMSATSSDTVWTYAWTVSTSLTSTTATVSGTDIAMNAYTGSESITFAIDNTAPRITISSQQGAETISGLTSVTIVFALSELSDNFTLSDISVLQGSLSNLSSTDSLVYTADYNIPANYTGTITIGVDSNTFTDQAGNPNTASSTVFSVDSERPEANIKVSDVLVNASEQTTITFSLTESSTSFTQSDVTILGGGSLSDFTSVSSSVYQVNYTPPSNSAGTVSIVIEEGAFTDMAGNGNVVDTTLFIIDTVPPSVVSFTSDDSDNIVRDSDMVMLTVTYSEPMSDSYIEIQGLVSTSMVISSTTDSRTWTFSWDVPQNNDGIVSATVSGSDLAGNPYSGIDNIEFTVDNTSPGVIISSQQGAETISGLDPVTLIFTLSEQSNNFTLSDINASQGSLSNLSSTDSVVYRADYSSPSNYSGTITIGVDSDSFTDQAGNPNTASSTTFSIDSARPEAAISISDST